MAEDTAAFDVKVLTDRRFGGCNGYRGTTLPAVGHEGVLLGFRIGSFEARLCEDCIERLGQELGRALSNHYGGRGTMYDRSEY